MSKDLPLLDVDGGGWKPKPKKDEANVAYITVDVAHGQRFDVAMQQINLFRNKDIKTWFCDIVHTANQTPYALHLKDQISGELKNILGYYYDDAHAVIHCNIANAKTFRARDKMYDAINTMREKGKAQNVNFKDPADQTQEVEY